MDLSEYEALLNSNYHNNLKLFKKHQNELYNKLTDTEDTAYSLELSIDGLNIAKDGYNLYPKDTLKFHQDLLEKYFIYHKESLIEYELNITLTNNSLKYFRIPTVSGFFNHQITQIYKKQFGDSPIVSELNPHHDEQFAMIVFGVGLGYHIPELVKKYKIEHLILAEINVEMIRASLYTLDWSEIFEYFNNTTRTIKFILPKQNNLSIEISNHIFNSFPLGNYNLATFTLFKTEFFMQTISELRKKNTEYTAGKYGFFDDEQWSIQHTLNNVKSNIPLLKDTLKKVSPDIPLFIVANGPSLDKYIEIIKQNRKKAIVVAAGSSICSLYNYGIKPDFLINMERSIVVYDAILTAGVTKEWLKDITFIGANCIHPKVFTLFRKSFVFLKGSDSGANIIEDNQFPKLSYINPTVSNAALRVFLYLGFKNISLFGMDFGYKSLSHHHSTQSSYYDDESWVNHNEKYEKIKVQGVDGDIVLTEPYYQESRLNLEVLTNSIARNNPDITIYNYSHGALISNTVCANNNKNYLKNYREYSKKEFDIVMLDIENQFQCYSEPMNLNIEKTIKNLDILKRQLKLMKEENLTAYSYLKKVHAVWVVFDEIFKTNNMKLMIQGTMITLMFKIYTYVSCQKQDVKTSTFINNAIDLLVTYIEDITIKIKNIDNHIDKPFF